MAIQYLTVILFSAILALHALASTDPLEVMALQDLFETLNNPSQLDRWKPIGGDPCGESWTGVSCSGSSVIHIKLQGLNLTGRLGDRLHYLRNLKHLDISLNNIGDAIPVNLPPNITHMDFAFNRFSQNIPHTLPVLKHLRHLNLSHNLLAGPIGNVFTDLQSLKELDLSCNKFTGDLPSSFGSLTNLTKLFLQSNKFTGSVFYLANLPLIDLNIVDNSFSGVIPREFQSIPNLMFWGNKFQVDHNALPWSFPLDNLPFNENITGTPTTKANDMENYPSNQVHGHNKKGLGPGGIAFVCGAAVLATCAALFLVYQMNRTDPPKTKGLEEESISAFPSPPMTTTDRDLSNATVAESPQTFPASSAFFVGQKPGPPLPILKTEATSRRKSFSKKWKISGGCKICTMAELQSATNNFSEQNLLGKGSLGSVYKAEFPDGQILAVKNINMVGLSFQEEEQFMDMIQTLSKLRHPNIVKLTGYCLEHGQHILVYEYVRNYSLDDALHVIVDEPLTWSIRLRIALGIAHALDYLHSAFSPPVPHCNIKASNILLDEDLMPCICDSGLAVLRPLTSNSVKLKASEIAIADSGYVAPETGKPGTDNTKSDVYAFGVLLLELLTRRLPVDISRSRQEQSLAKWASSRLHDRDELEQMIDPEIKGTIHPKALSRFADVVSMCIQPVKEFRPTMSEVVESLTLLTTFNTNKNNAAVAAELNELDQLERSFRSTHTRFLGSPTPSHASVEPC